MAKKCKICRKEFRPFNSLQVACGPRCAIEVAKKQAEKARQEVAKVERAKHRERRKEVRRRSDWLDMLQKLVNQYVMYVLHPEDSCCTCEKPRAQAKFDAGHFITRGSRPELRFEHTNIHPQCSINCNLHGSGMRNEYEKFIIDTYGQEHLDWLNGPHPSLKDRFPTWQDIEDEIKRYRKLLRAEGLTPRV